MVRPSSDQLREDPNLVHIDLDERCGEYRRRAHDYVRKHYPDVSAEDVAQETILRLWGMRSRINRRPDALLFEIASNVARDVLRRRRSELNVPSDATYPPAARSPEEHAMDKLDGDLAWQALNELRPSDRDLVVSRHVQGVSCRDVSTRENISEDAARQRSWRAQSRLRCNFDRLSRLLIPLCAFRELVRWIRRHVQSASLVAATGVVAIAAAIGAGDLLPDRSPEGNDVVSQPREPVVARQVPRDDKSEVDATRRTPSRVPIPPDAPNASRNPSGTEGGSLPLRSKLELSPGTGAGPKQENAVEIETPMGPVGTDGASFATGPASVTSACSDQEGAACFLMRPITMDGRRSP